MDAIINSLDIYQYRRLPNNGTKSEDVNTVADIVRHFNLEKEWMGDLCLPQKYSWIWMDCNQDSSPRIIAMFKLMEIYVRMLHSFMATPSVSQESESKHNPCLELF
ncbi:hypothetical protein SUGI_1085150 [Cryptomeria japonica]|nr:hypothetical protein SUGI_1085150 [Cryptomeria japonica]